MAFVVLALGLALALGTMKLMGGFESEASYQEQGNEMAPEITSGGGLRKGILTAGATILVVGSIFLVFPQGLSVWVSILPAYIRGWVEPSGVPAIRVLAALAIYQPLGLVFGLIGAVRGWVRRNRLAQLLSLWLVFSLGLTLLFPARQVGDLVWVLVPLWALAALELGRSFIWEPKGGFASLIQATLIFLIMALFWINLSGLNVAIAGAGSLALRVGILGGVLALAALITALVTFGWSWEVAQRGLVWGLSIALGIYGVANMWSASQLDSRETVELWDPFPRTADADLLVKTIEDFSKWSTGRTDSIDVIVPVQSSSLSWALRNFSQVHYVPERQMLAIIGEPSVVVARQTQEAPSLAASYGGQDFAWWSYPGWMGPLPPDFFQWLVFRKAPLRQEQLILWARSDLFPEGFSLPEAEVPALPEGIIPGEEVEP